MSFIQTHLSNNNLYKSPFFSIIVDSNIMTTNIKMELFTDFMTTSNIPLTISRLKKELPSILNSKCFNENNYSFRREVKDTEIGHLLEHVLLEYISEFKRQHSLPNPIHNGLTQWNWNRDIRGVFHISLDLGASEEQVLEIAIIKSIKLVDSILDTAPGLKQEINLEISPSIQYIPLELKDDIL